MIYSVKLSVDNIVSNLLDISNSATLSGPFVGGEDGVAGIWDVISFINLSNVST